MVLVVFAVITVIGQILNVLLCLALDNIFSPMVGALTFVVLYMLVFAGAWLLAVRIVEGREPQAGSPKMLPQTPLRTVSR